MNKKLKSVLFCLYLIIDFLVFILAIMYRMILYLNIDPIFGIDFIIVYYILLGTYLLINSIIGILWTRKHSADVDSGISNMWFFPMYLINILGIFFLMLPLHTAFILFTEKKFYEAALCMLFLLIIIFMIFGQVKWEKMIVTYLNNKTIQRYICIENPIKCMLIILFLCAFARPWV